MIMKKLSLFKYTINLIALNILQNKKDICKLLKNLHHYY